MVGKKKQNYSYEQVIEGILNKFIEIEPKIMMYKQKIMTEMLREKYVDPSVPIKKIRRCYKMVDVNGQPHFIDEFNNLWTEHKVLAGIVQFNDTTNTYEYYLFAEIKKDDDKIQNILNKIEHIN